MSELENQVICLRAHEWQVVFRGKVLTTTFNSKGAALAYLNGLENGRKVA